MIRLNALELLKKQGKTKYWLYKQLDMSYQNFNKMINNETKSIKYENIERCASCFVARRMICLKSPMIDKKSGKSISLIKQK